MDHNATIGVINVPYAITLKRAHVDAADYNDEQNKSSTSNVSFKFVLLMHSYHHYLLLYNVCVESYCSLNTIIYPCVQITIRNWS